MLVQSQAVPWSPGAHVCPDRTRDQPARHFLLPRWEGSPVFRASVKAAGRAWEHTSLTTVAAFLGGDRICITLNRLVTHAQVRFPLSVSRSQSKEMSWERPDYYLSVRLPGLFHQLQLGVSNAMGEVDERENAFSLGAKLPHTGRDQGTWKMRSGTIAVTYKKQKQKKPKALWKTFASYGQRFIWTFKLKKIK